MTNFSVDQHPESDGVLRLAIQGEVDLATGEMLAGAISDAVTSGNFAKLVVDLDEVTFLDSTGINVLVVAKNLAAEYGVAYLVTNPHGLVHRTLAITGVLAHLTQTP